MTDRPPPIWNGPPPPGVDYTTAEDRFEREAHDLRRACGEKDAEIERLRAVIHVLDEQNDKLHGECMNQFRLRLEGI